MRILLSALSALLVVSCAAQDSAPAEIELTEAKVYDPENTYQPSDDVMGEVQQVLAKASTNRKLAIIVMGANWCHDSRAFVELFNDEELRAVMDEKYEVLFVDVGFLEHGRDVITHFGMPVIYGTPTVLVVRPADKLVINRNDMHRWRDASKIDTIEAIEYFTHMASDEALSEIIMAQDRRKMSDALVVALAEIDAWEEGHAERLYEAFEVLGPLLAMDKDDRPDHTDRYWQQVADFRYQFTDDLAAVRAQAWAQNEAEEITLDYPEYEPFEWE